MLGNISPEVWWWRPYTIDAAFVSYIYILYPYKYFQLAKKNVTKIQTAEILNIMMQLHVEGLPDVNGVSFPLGTVQTSTNEMMWKDIRMNEWHYSIEMIEEPLKRDIHFRKSFDSNGKMHHVDESITWWPLKETWKKTSTFSISKKYLNLKKVRGGKRFINIEVFESKKPSW